MLQTRGCCYMTQVQGNFKSPAEDRPWNQIHCIYLKSQRRGKSRDDPVHCRTARSGSVGRRIMLISTATHCLEQNENKMHKLKAWLQLLQLKEDHCMRKRARQQIRSNNS